MEAQDRISKAQEKTTTGREAHQIAQILGNFEKLCFGTCLTIIFRNPTARLPSENLLPTFGSVMP